VLHAAAYFGSAADLLQAFLQRCFFNFSISTYLQMVNILMAVQQQPGPSSKHRSQHQQPSQGQPAFAA
jgi:hypothetical protein